MAMCADSAAVIAELREWQRALRTQFPIVTGHPDLAYLDSAATSQKPRAVLDAVQTYLTTTNANAGRGTYPWANRTTALVEQTRDRIRRFLDDPAPERSAVRFTSGATEGLRTIARDWLPGYLTDGDEIVVPAADHRANIEPWREVHEQLARQGVHVRLLPMPYQQASGDYDHTALAHLAGPRTRFVAATHVHHVYGGNMNIHRIRQAVGSDAVICLDAAQSVGHLPVSVDGLDVDFVVFSGHKALALPGTGAVWARQARGPAFTPCGWSGTPNTVGIASLAAALDWLDGAGTDRIGRWTVALAARLTDGLRRLNSYEVLGCQTSLAVGSPVQQRQGIVTFRHRDIGSMVRCDHHCQGDAGEDRESVRVSLHVYNTVEEIDRLLDVLATLG